MSNLRGISRIFQVDDDIGQLIAIRANNCVINETPEFTQDLAYTGIDEDQCNPKQVVDVTNKQTVFQLTVDVGSIDEQAMDFIWWNNRPHEEPSITLPRYKSGVVTSGAIAVPGITADQKVYATIAQDTAPGDYPLIFEAGGTPTTADNFAVAAGQLNFNAAQEGKRVMYSYFETFTARKIIGATKLLPHASVSIATVICANRFAGKKVYFPRCSTISGVNIDGGAETFQREYIATIPTELGWVLPYAVDSFNIPVVP